MDREGCLRRADQTLRETGSEASNPPWRINRFIRAPGDTTEGEKPMWLR